MAKKSDDIVIKVPPYGLIVQSIIDRMHTKSDKPVTDLELKAEVYVHLNQLAKFCKEKMDELKPDLRDSGQVFEFPQYGLVMSPQAGTASSEVDFRALLNEARQMDIDDPTEGLCREAYILNAATISKKALEGLGDDGKTLAAKHFHITGRGEATVQVRTLSLSRLKALITSGKAHVTPGPKVYEGFDETAEPDPVGALVAKEGDNVVPWAAPVVETKEPEAAPEAEEEAK